MKILNLTLLACFCLQSCNSRAVIDCLFFDWIRTVDKFNIQLMCKHVGLRSANNAGDGYYLTTAVFNFVSLTAAVAAPQNQQNYRHASWYNAGNDPAQSVPGVI